MMNTFEAIVEVMDENQSLYLWTIMMSTFEAAVEVMDEGHRHGIYGQ